VVPNISRIAAAEVASAPPSTEPTIQPPGPPPDGISPL
jgi:hypothetical protein